MLHLIRLVMVAGVSLMLGCALEPASTALLPSPALQITPTLSAVAPTPTPDPTPAGPITLSVWWPDALAPVDNQRAASLLAEYADAFRASQVDTLVNLRLKKAAGPGSIMETLRTAVSVAPSALPDVTLLRRSDLLAAARQGVIQPLQGQVASAILGDLYPVALELGRANNILYGLTYALDVQHMAYRPLVMSGSFARFQDVLEARQSFVFPAGVTLGLSDVFLLQYLAAGGTLNELNQGRPNTEALATVLAFYEQAVSDGIVAPSVLDYSTSADYLLDFSSRQLDAALVTSTQYLELLRGDSALDAAPIPLPDGDPSTVVDGWIFVVVTTDPTRQAAAFRFIEWMVDSQRHATYTRAVNTLPSLQSSLRQWDGGTYGAFVTQLLTNARVPLLDVNNPTLRSIQNGFAAVISGQRSATQALDDIVSREE